MKEHSMNLQVQPFEKIKDGLKTVELRLYDEKRQQVAVGDVIVFRCGEDMVRTEVKALHRYPDFAALFAAMPKAMLGYGADALADPADMEAYYTKEEQSRYGVVGIELVLTER